ncbi:ATP-binding protein [Caballeronia sp. 15715]|uniref:ATP-binding protein n=1 Tax=Caballeronia sp. 15715 TaxID=3391030 RepID=UPI0039E330BD
MLFAVHRKALEQLHFCNKKNKDAKMPKPATEVVPENESSSQNHLLRSHDLEAHMDELKAVDVIRHQSALMRTAGHEALLSIEPAPNEKLDLYHRYKRARIEWQFSKKDSAAIKRVRAVEAYVKSFCLSDLLGEDMPVLAAAEAIRTFVSVGHLSTREPTLLAWYWIVREIFSANSPDWCLGGARAGSTGWANAYVTSQCVQALSDLAINLEKTAEFLLTMQRAAEQLKALNNEKIPEAWRLRDKERLKKDVETTIGLASNMIAFNLESFLTPSELEIDVFFKDGLKKTVLRELQKLKESLKSARDCLDVIAVIPDTNKNMKEENVAQFHELIKSCRHLHDPVSAERDSEEGVVQRADLLVNCQPMIVVPESQTAHILATQSMKMGIGHAESALRAIASGVGNDDWMADVAAEYSKAANDVRLGMSACKGYLSGVIDRQIAACGPNDNRSWEPGELAFAASAYGLASGIHSDESDVSRLKLAAKLVYDDLSADGTISNRSPYHANESTRYFNDTDQLLGAVAELVRAAKHPIDEHLAGYLFRYFDRQCFREPGTKKILGWFSEFDHKRESASVRATTDAVESLGAVNRMLDEGINHTILEHFTVRQPSSTKLYLDTLFYPDYGFVQKDISELGAITRTSVAMTMQRMRSHVARIPGVSDQLNSIVLYGPGGTGKTTLIEALAKTCNVPLVEVTPSDLAKGGESDVEKRARAVFEALSMLSQAVILFDEFDPVLKRRDESGEKTTNIFSFLTPGMLPKLKSLHENASDRRVAYALVTNLIGSLDVPAVRQGRFDAAVGIYPPDPLSRLGYIHKVCRVHLDSGKHGLKEGRFQMERVLEMVRKTSGLGMTPMTAAGWFRIPEKLELDDKPIGYIYKRTEAMPIIPGVEERFSKKKGIGPFASEEFVEWGWLTRWENSLLQIPKNKLNKVEPYCDWPTSEESIKAVTVLRAMADETGEAEPSAAMKAIDVAMKSGTLNSRFSSLAASTSATQQLSQTQAISIAVSAQMVADHWWPPTDATKKMGQDYLYTSQSMPQFMAKVAKRLVDGNPSFIFTCDQGLCDQSLSCTVPQLMANIDGHTRQAVTAQ